MEKQMTYDPYSRLNQQLADGAFVGGSFYLAFLIRYEWVLPTDNRYQFFAFVSLVIAAQLFTNFLFGLHRIQWRYIGLRDVFRVAESYVAFSCLLLLARVSLPLQTGIFRFSTSVIPIDLALALLGALGIRFLRRYIYEVQSRQADQAKAKRQRRLLLIGAGRVGANVAKEMASNPSINIVGFLDDDPHKIGCVIGGVKVLGPTSQLAAVVRTQQIDDVLICIAHGARSSVNRLVALLETLPVTSNFVPTITEILDTKNGLRTGVSHSGTRGNGHSPRLNELQTPTPDPHPEIRNKNILITGGGGFIGSSLAERLAKDNQVVLLDRFFHSQPIAFTSLHKSSNVRMVEADILEGQEVSDLAREADIVVHAAAIVGVGRVCSFPRETLETNFEGTSRILKALGKSSRLERFLYFSTSEVFGVNSFRVHENTPAAVGPAAEARWSYAIAKLAGEHLVKAYHREGGMPVVTVRPFNVFGPRRLGAHAVQTFVLNSLLGNGIEIHGDGSQIRSWCYIEDFCDALIAMLSLPGAVGEDFNIGNPKNTLTIFELAQRIVELTGSSTPIEFEESPFPDIGIRVPSLDKARRILGYQPVYDLNRSLELTIDWYRKNLSFFGAPLRVAAGA
jgi:nucleoside-diphosphate-sugar epimerase